MQSPWYHSSQLSHPLKQDRDMNIALQLKQDRFTTSMGETGLRTYSYVSIRCKNFTRTNNCVSSLAFFFFCGNIYANAYLRIHKSMHMYASCVFIAVKYWQQIWAYFHVIKPKYDFFKIRQIRLTKIRHISKYEYVIRLAKRQICSYLLSNIDRHLCFDTILSR